jgi:hypothetical protein
VCEVGNRRCSGVRDDEGARRWTVGFIAVAFTFVKGFGEQTCYADCMTG